MAGRSLWPREHGAYFQLAIPLAAALVLRVPSLAMIALATAAGLAFVAHEPLLVALGHRGPRMLATTGPRARGRLAVLGGAAVALGVGGLAVAPAATLPAAMIATAAGAAVLAFAWRRAEHTLAGELVAAVALTGASVPVLVAGGAPLAGALAWWAGWALGFAATVLAIHRVIARHRRPARWLDRAIAAALVATAAACISASQVIAAPLVVLAAALVIAPPPASRLRAVGLAVVAAANGSCVLVVLGWG